MVSNPVFTGFSSNISSKKVHDVDLVKQDLLNRINTRKGERLMNPNFGTTIWDLLFEHKSEFVVNEIKRELTDVINSDPRLTLQQLEIQEKEYGYTANLTLFFSGVDIVDQMKIDFNKDNNTASRIQ